MEKITAFLKNDDLQSILKKFRIKVKEKADFGFNIINLISDKYYYENLHSDIISAFLDPKGAHNKGNFYLNIFLNCLKEQEPKIEINIDDFIDAVIKREESKIDIKIIGQNGKVIFIENKINNASDTFRQLPEYVKKISQEKVVAIVYLPLNPNKKPDNYAWTETEKDFIKSKFISLSAESLLQNWVIPSMDNQNDEATHILYQYSKLIKKLSNYMSELEPLKKFYQQFVINENKYQDAITVKDLIEKLPMYLTYKIKEAYDVLINEYDKKCMPFNEVGQDTDNSIVRFKGAVVDDVRLILKIVCSYDSYKFQLYDADYTKHHLERIYDLKNKLIDNGLDLSKLNDNGDNELEMSFKFPEQESDLYIFFDAFLEKLKVVKKI